LHSTDFKTKNICLNSLKKEFIMPVANLSAETFSPDAVRYQDLEQKAEFFQLDGDLQEQIFGIPLKTQARMRADNAVLSPLVVDRLNRFNRITQQTINLFEDTKKALQWLQTPKNSLAGITPLAALSTDEGAKQVEEVLYRTEYGIYS
jgi:putative toxin-antitoxin system antitoxin component (TIGR02293 family)